MFKGWFGEKKTQFNLWLSLNTKLYRRFHDVIIPSQHGTTQIDHILVSPFGLFIVETKNYTGWIYGSESQANWTQVIYKSKYLLKNGGMLALEIGHNQYSQVSKQLRYCGYREINREYDLNHNRKPCLINYCPFKVYSTKNCPFKVCLLKF